VCSSLLVWWGAPSNRTAHPDGDACLPAWNSSGVPAAPSVWPRDTVVNPIKAISVRFRPAWTGWSPALRQTFQFWQRYGLHIVPNHYYHPIPDTRGLQQDLWEKPSELVGIDINEEAQLHLLFELSSAYREEYERFPRAPTSVPHEYFVDNGGFGAVDGEVLYCMIRQFCPRRVLEIGSGNSTYLAAQALLENEQKYGWRGELVACEPYPNDVLKRGFPGLTTLVESEVQKVPLEEFSRLAGGDILFIDSSHVLKCGSDVQYEFLEILPRLHNGVLVHVHDVFLPYEYPREWIMDEHLFWSEQYLLQAFLSFNSSFEVMWAGHYMHRKHPDRLRAAFPSYDERKLSPRSFWLKRVE